MVLYISTDYQVLGIVYLDQLKGACHTNISYHNIYIRTPPITTGIHWDSRASITTLRLYHTLLVKCDVITHC